MENGIESSLTIRRFRLRRAIVFSNSCQSTDSISKLAMALAILLAAGSCQRTENGMSLDVLYSPPVVFEGKISGETVTLRGHLAQPNRCELQHDTIAMFMCSDDYAPGETPKGRYLRVLVFPVVRDTGDTIPLTMLGTANLLVKYGDHTAGTTQSFQVVPADSNYKDTYATAQIEYLQRWRRGRIALTEFSAASGPVFGSSAIGPMEITEGVIDGRIQ